MIIWLDKTLNGYFEGDSPPQGDIVDSFGNLANARGEGKHLVLGERPILEKLSSLDELSSRHRAIYRRLAGRASGNRSLLKAISSFVRVKSQPPCFAPTESEGEITLPIGFFEDSASTQETVLLSEDWTDTKYYVKMGETYLAKENIGAISVNMRKSGSGGIANAVRAFKIRRRRSQFCLCVVDSDRKAPDADPGPNSKQLSNEAEASEPIFKVVMTHGTELENTIPVYGWDTVVNSDSLERYESLQFVRSIEGTEMYDARNFVDLKEGTQLCDLLTYATDSEVAEFWRSRIPGLPSYCSSVKEECATARTCANAECECTVVRGFGDTAAGQVVKNLGQKSPAQISNNLGDVEQEWSRIGSVVAAWGGAGHPMRAL